MNPNIDKQEMRDYLLGTLETDRRAQLEEKILCDPAVYEDLLLVEEDLIDQYLSGGLSKAERYQFETHFLITAERQKNLRFGRLLKRYLHSHPVLAPSEKVVAAVRKAEKPAPATKLLLFPMGTFARGPATALAAAVVVAFMGIALVSWNAIRKPAQPPNVLPVALAPGSMRSLGATTQRVHVPPVGFDVRFELQVTNTSFHNYKSELFRENQSLKSADKLKVETKSEQQHIVPFTVDGDMLSPGDYQVKLSGVWDSGQDELIDKYSFRVIE